MMSNVETIRSLWRAIERRDWPAVETFCHASLTYDLPQSGERYDRDGFLRLNREYPGDWHVTLERLVDGGEWIVTEVSVSLSDRTDCGVSLFRLVDGRVAEIREYWPEPFDVPDWRQGWRQMR